MAERTCILSGRPCHASAVRFVAGLTAAVVDLAEKLPGRGAWIEGDADAVRQADGKGFSAQGRCRITGRRLDIKRIAQMMRERALATAGLARRAGCLVGGAGKLAASTDEFVGLLPRLMLERELRRLSSRLGVEWTTRLFSAEELGRVFSRDSLAFVGVSAGRSKNWRRLSAARWTAWRAFLPLRVVRPGDTGVSPRKWTMGRWPHCGGCGSSGKGSQMSDDSGKSKKLSLSGGGKLTLGGIEAGRCVEHARRRTPHRPGRGAPQARAGCAASCGHAKGRTCRRAAAAGGASGGPGGC